MGRNRKKSGAGAVEAQRYDIFGNVVPETATPAAPATPPPAPPARAVRIDTKDPRFDALRKAEDKLDSALVANSQQSSEDAQAQVRAAQAVVDQERDFFSPSVLASWDDARQTEREATRTNAQQTLADPAAVIRSVISLNQRRNIDRNIGSSEDTQRSEEYIRMLRTTPTPTKAQLQQLSTDDLKRLRRDIELATLNEAADWSNHIERLSRRGQSKAHWDALTESVNKLIDLRMAVIEALEGYPQIISQPTKAGRAKREDIRRTLQGLFIDDVVSVAFDANAENNAERRYEGMRAVAFPRTFWNDWKKKMRRHFNGDERIM